MKFGFFFGAGAEIGYGLPSGGKFAIDLFRQDVSSLKTEFRKQLREINNLSVYATSWLPDKFSTQRIHAFGKNEFTNLIESSIEYRKKEIIRRLNDFDNEGDQALKELGLEKQKLIDLFNAKMASIYGEELYSTAVQMNPLLANDVKLFGTELYSAVLAIISSPENTANLQRYAGAFLQLLVGAHGQDLVQRLNQELFESAPDNIPIFDDISGMFKLEFNRAGFTALELLLDKQQEYDVENGTLADFMSAICQKILENLFTTVLDYQSLIDNHFRYLFSPKTEWAKFSKMVIFLRATREYIVKQLENAGDLPDHGYYHDLQNCADFDVEIAAIGTANYNNLVEKVSGELGYTIPEVKHLNGSINDYYNPYKNSVISCSSEEDVPKDEIHVPFILTQSGLKPLTSVDMSRRYVSLYDDYLTCDAIIVVGYGFNIDDSHINGLFRQLIDDGGKHIYWVCLNSEGSVEEQKRNLGSKLRINSGSRDRIHIIPVDQDTRLCGETIWIEKIASMNSQQSSS